ncbi:MAG: tetratricopeptide repeat protein [Pyrinomonadaceae bacterium]
MRIRNRVLLTTLLLFVSSLGLVAHKTELVVQAGHSFETSRPIAQTPTRLEIGKPIQTTISAGQRHSYLIDATGGNLFVELVVNQRAVDVMVALFGPDGTKLGDTDRTESYEPETIIGIMGPAGEYRVEVEPVEKSAGKYEITLKELRTPREGDRARIDAMAAALAVAVEADELREKGDAASLNSAIEKYTEGLRLWRSAGDQHWEASTLRAIGSAYHLLKQKDKALAAYNQALAIFQALKNPSSQALTLRLMASLLDSLNSTAAERRKALEYHNQARPLLGEIGDRKHEVETLNYIGLIYGSLGEYSTSLKYFNNALLLARTVSDRTLEAKILYNIGRAYSFLSEPQKALELFNQALSIFKAVGDSAGESRVVHNMGSVYHAIGERHKALDFYNRSLALDRANGNKIGEGTNLNDIGGIYSDMGEKQKALELYDQALVIHREAGNRSGEGTALTNIGNVYLDLGQKQNAFEYFNNALSITRSIDDLDGEATALVNIGLLHADAGDEQKALKFYHQALAISRALNDKRGEATILNNIGNVYSDLGENKKSLEILSQSLMLHRTAEDRSGEATTLNNLGALYLELGERQKAFAAFNLALPLTRAVGEPEGEALTLNNIGGLYDSLGDKEKALDYYTQALTLYRKIGLPKGEATALNNIGTVHGELGDKLKAWEYFKLAVEIHKKLGDRQGQAAILTNIGKIFDWLHEEQEALKYYELALALTREIGDRKDEAVILANTGLAYDALGQKQKALGYYNLALLLHRAVNDRDQEATTLGLAMHALRETKPALAVFYGKQAINTLQQLRGHITSLDQESQKTFLKSKVDDYRELADLLIAQGRLAEAHQVLSSFKDQQYFDFNRVTSDRQSQLGLTPLEALAIERYETTSKALETIGSEITLLARKLQPNPQDAEKLKGLKVREKAATDEFLNALKKNEAELQSSSAEHQSLEVSETVAFQTALRELSRQTGQKAVAVYTLVGGDNFRALVITADNITAVSQPFKGETLNQKALQLWALLQSDKYDPRPLSQDLYAAVFKPLEQLLPKETTTILWSLDGNLRYVPMGALHDGKQYLVERHNHVVFTRADSERLLRGVSAKWTGLGLGSSQGHTVELLGDKISFNPLPGVTEELRALFRQPGSKSGLLDGEVLPDARFTKAAMLAGLKQKRPLVHISSHFSFRPGDEARSFLLLGDGTAMTLAEMKQQTDLFAGVELLTLSACNTAAQQAGANGREIDGFAELAQRLGAGSVMATLWPVADNSTPWLMREFYETRQNGGGLTKAEAFRRAQLALLNGTAQTKPLPAAQKGPSSSVQIVIGGNGKRDGAGTRAGIVYIGENDAPAFKLDESKPFAHPFYWAPFILIGNWK